MGCCQTTTSKNKGVDKKQATDIISIPRAMLNAKDMNLEASVERVQVD